MVGRGMIDTEHSTSHLHCRRGLQYVYDYQHTVLIRNRVVSNL
jgi:hypothetical protein